MAQKIETYNLDEKYIFIHKEAITESDFGMDHTTELIENGFGMYSSKMVKTKIGPLKSQFFRIGFCRKGSLQVDFGLETYTHHKDTIHFNFPGQLFSMKNVSKDMLSYYILFTQDFINEVIPTNIQERYPFLDYSGIPFFKLSKPEAQEIEKYFYDIDAEIKNNNADRGLAIKHLISLILISAKRSYTRQGLHADLNTAKPISIVVRFKKLVNQHFLTLRNVSAYASRLSVTPKYLSKVIKDETGKTPSEFINEMVMLEIKSLLRHTDLSISEIAYHLEFSEPAHLTNFFKKHQGESPVQFRKK